MLRIHLALPPALFLLCAALPAQQAGQAAAPGAAGGSGGQVFIGARGANNDGYQGKLNEYNPANQGVQPAFGADFWVQQGGYYVDAAGEYAGDAKDQKYGIDFQANRYLRLRSFYIQYLHRLDHDPLKDLDAAKGGPMVWAHDWAPGTEYKTGYSELKTDLEFTVPGATWLRFRAAHRTFERHGGVQARSISKCSSCHVQGQTKMIDQRLHDLSAGVTLQFRKASIDYDYLNRQFNETGLTPTFNPDSSIHPVTLLPVFGNRVSFDDRNGPAPHNMVPDMRKSQHVVRGRAELPKDARLSGAFSSSNARNKYTGLGVDSWGWNGKFTVPLGKRFHLMAQGRQLDLESDDVFVKIDEPVALGGPQAGKTYAQAYPDFGSPSFMRYSTRSRNRLSMKGELASTLAKYTNLRAGYEFRRLKRDHYEIEQTDTNRFYVSLNSRMKDTAAGDWTARFRYILDQSKDPFLHHKAALPPALQLEPTPGASPFAGLQYYKIYAAREADLTSFPTMSHLAEPTLTWMPSPRFSATVHYRYQNLKNDDLNRSDWKRSVHMPGVELWFSPLEKLDFTAAYTFHNERSETLFGIPVYDG